MGCLNASQPGAVATNAEIIATSQPVYHLLKDLGVNATVLMPPGASPHHWSPSYQDILAMERAQYVFATNRILEPWARGNVVYLFPTQKNSHTWLVPTYIRAAIQKVCSRVSCKRTDLNVSCESLKGLRVLQLFPTLDPMAEACGFEVETIALSPEALPSNYVEQCRGRCVLVPSIVPQHVIQHLKDNGCEVVVFDPLMTDGYQKGFPELVQKIKACARPG